MVDRPNGTDTHRGRARSELHHSDDPSDVVVRHRNDAALVDVRRPDRLQSVARDVNRVAPTRFDGYRTARDAGELAHSSTVGKDDCAGPDLTSGCQDRRDVS